MGLAEWGVRLGAWLTAGALFVAHAVRALLSQLARRPACYLVLCAAVLVPACPPERRAHPAGASGRPGADGGQMAPAPVRQRAASAPAPLYRYDRRQLHLRLEQ